MRRYRAKKLRAVAMSARRTCSSASARVVAMSAGVALPSVTRTAYWTASTPLPVPSLPYRKR